MFAKILLRENFTVVGLDNINNYYDVNLKYSRLEQLGVQKKDAENFHVKAESNLYHGGFSFFRMNLEDREALPPTLSK